MNEILTPCILQTIIICISSLLALYCIASLIKSLARKKNNCKTCPLENKNNCETCHEKKHLSYKLIVAFLVFLLVILFTHKFYADDNVFNFMSFASAIISIILAVLTIIYTYYTQGTTTSSVEKMEHASIKMGEAAANVENASNSYMDSANLLRDNISQILDKIGHVEEQTNQILIEQMKNNQKKSSSGKTPTMSDENIRKFVDSASNFGIIALYAASLAHERNMDFNFKVIEDGDQVWYSAGFIISTSCFNLLEAVLAYNNGSLSMSVSEFSEKLKEEVKSKVEKKIKDKEDFYITNKKAIDTYFEK